MDKEYGICHLSIVPLRAEASDRSEIRSQLLFGDCFEVVEVSEKWVRILTIYDEYSGWIDRKQYLPLNKQDYGTLLESTKVLGPAPFHLASKIRTGEPLYLVSGSSIPTLQDDNYFSLGAEQYQLLGSPAFATGTDFSSLVCEYAHFFLHAPYLWGGKSLFGIDCSGFTQVVFKMLGVKLKRDAWQQAEQGEVVSFLQEARAGDLAFFDNEEGRITHVGIMLDDQKIIHASGRVKVDPIDDQGIYSLDLRKHTHKLRIIKRYV
ncbi:C40 family peptidase [Pedobacter sp. SYSU D00535]|uniref:C40 family peptidase n=1 Tax=Pedobacter sp. SYSU D00535 TaxID=2810308 RepID=UPI001A96C449|nr:C40 family peptidase [Pedobacter sp. SYSU D00535]